MIIYSSRSCIKCVSTSHHLYTCPKSETWPFSLGADFNISTMQNEDVLNDFLHNGDAQHRGPSGFPQQTAEITSKVHKVAQSHSITHEVCPKICT